MRGSASMASRGRPGLLGRPRPGAREAPGPIVGETWCDGSLGAGLDGWRALGNSVAQRSVNFGYNPVLQTCEVRARLCTEVTAYRLKRSVVRLCRFKLSKQFAVHRRQQRYGLGKSTCC